MFPASAPLAQSGLLPIVVRRSQVHPRQTYQAIYEDLVLRHIGRLPITTDGIAELELAEAERRLGYHLPTSLRAYYLIAGNISEINQTHNRLVQPQEFQIDETGLIFMEEAHDVVWWYVKSSDLSLADPPVWQLVNSIRPELYEEGASVSQFLVSMFDWQAGFISDPSA